MSKRIGFDASRLQVICPGAYSALPKAASKTGALSFYYTYDGDLRATDGTVTYTYQRGMYSDKRKRFAYSWCDVTTSVGKTRKS